MSAFPLPELSPTASPEFVDAEGCKAWLDHVPLANVGAAQRELLAQVREFNRFPANAAHRFAVMELLREPVNFVQIEQAKRFANRALPMAQAESDIFEDTNALWEAMRSGYLRCLDSALNGDAAMRAQGALICQRVLAYAGLKMFHHYRAYRQVPPREWRGVHAAYAAAERLEVAEEPVKDFLNRDVHDTSPRIAYARALLMGLCNPNELAQRQLTFVAYLLERWAAKLDVGAEPLPEEEGVLPLVIDLKSDRLPERLDTSASTRVGEARYLDARKLAKSLRNRVGLLRKGESPAKLALGEDCIQPSCEQLLVFLFRQWCQGKLSRATERRAAASAVQVCSELGVIHSLVTGRAFRQPQGELTNRQRDEIATFGRVSTRQADDPQPSVAVEQWRLEDESSQGLRMIRRAGTPGKRYTHGQLVCVRLADAPSHRLGQVRWLMEGEGGDLHAGIRLLPGVPAGCSVRATGVNVQNEKFVEALLLAAVPSIAAPMSILLQPGSFKPKRVLEFIAEGEARIRLLEVLERGLDYERVTFEKLP